ncbi:hypothetical protein BSPWISOXPB_20 [uncultured Gammaproteobacteria bacterium]|nr:hypothetical protein BSPWISOXPB_20 [uncultured Gammaproteobacteria bacterium]
MPQKTLGILQKINPVFAKTKNSGYHRPFSQIPSTGQPLNINLITNLPFEWFLESLKSDLKGSVPNISISQQTYATRAQARVLYLNILKCFTTRLDGIQRLIIVRLVIMKRSFIKIIS